MNILQTCPRHLSDVRSLHFTCVFSAFSALTLLVGWQEGHLACKN